MPEESFTRLDEDQMVHATQIFQSARIGLAWVEETDGEEHTVYSLSVFGVPSGSEWNAEKEEVVYVFSAPIDVVKLMVLTSGLLFDQRGVEEFKKTTLATLERMKKTGAAALADAGDIEEKLTQKAREANDTPS